MGQKLKQSFSTLLIAALLLSQQNLPLLAAQIKVQAVVPAANTGAMGAVGGRLGPAAALNGASLAPVGGLSLSAPGLAAVPSVLPQASFQAPIAAPAAAALSAAPITAVPTAKAPTTQRLSQVSASLAPELKAIASQDTAPAAAATAGEAVMAKALGRKTVELPALAEPASLSDASHQSFKVSVALRKGLRGPQDGLPQDGSWWRDTASQHIAVSVPMYSLRREQSDPGVGKFTDFGAYYRDVLAKQGVDTIHLLPHFATLGESPYAPVSLYALNESNIDWSAVDEVKDDPALLAKLVADPADRQAVNYKAIWAREEAVAADAYRKFQAEHISRRTSRSKDYLAFLKQNAYWLEDYAEFMALSRLIGKPVLDWTKADEAKARHDPRFIGLKNTRYYAQFNAFAQFRGAMAAIRQAGGHVLFDIPMFRAKNSVDAWKHPEYFKDIKTRNPGIVNQYIHEDWLDLALWDWTQLKSQGYRPMLDPFRHWLGLGFDGARVDALHFAYNFGNGQLASGDEPGDDYVSALGAVIKERDALPLAEAFEGKAENAHRFGFITVYGDWKKLSSHDDPRGQGFMYKLFDLLRQDGSHRSGRFVGYTLGDEWNDPVPVKVVKDGNSYWRYRVPLPSDPDYKRRAGDDARAQMGGMNAMKQGNVWQAASALWETLKKAGDSFIKHFNGSVQIWAASLDWFQEEWGRDTFISLPGLLLSTGRFAEARENMRAFARHEKDGLIPNRIPEAGRPAEYNTVDGSMWFVQAVKSYAEAARDTAFVDEMLPVLRRVMERYASGTGYKRYGRFNRIYMDSDGLIISPAQATWMDADPEGRDKPVTPRNGKAVEINALWYANLRFLARQERRLGGETAARVLDARADLVKKSFNDKFWFVTEANKKAWGGSGGALADVVEGDPHGLAVRPNMLVAVSRGEDLLSPERQAAVVLAATRDLLTPYGMRTLSYRDSNYRGTYDTSQPPLEKDQAYHQGTAWPWLIGPYVDALVRVRRAQGWGQARISAEVAAVMTPLVEHMVSHPEGSLPEVFDGGSPADALLKFSLADPLGLRDVIGKVARRQNRGGTRSQAWSVAEAIRVLVEYGLLGAKP
jgi:glycogen debranching enzyme